MQDDALEIPIQGATNCILQSSYLKLKTTNSSLDIQALSLRYVQSWAPIKLLIAIFCEKTNTTLKYNILLYKPKDLKILWPRRRKISNKK